MSEAPNNLEAEESVLGAMLLSNQAIDAISESLVASDFYKPSHGLIFETMVNLRTKGIPVDAITVYESVKSRGLQDVMGEPAQFIALQANVPSIANARHYAKAVIETSRRRRLIGEGAGLMQRANDPTLDVDDIVDEHRAFMTDIGSTMIDHEPDDIAVEDFMKRDREAISPWAVHGIIRKRHKIMLVAAEGLGKTWILRYVALCAAYGIQPFRHTLLKRPVRTLIADFENPEDSLYDSFEVILKKVTAFNPQSETVNRLWWRPAGINLRNRADFAEFENVIRARKPELVCIGPLYAMYQNSAKDFGWETAAKEVQSALKRLMVRYNFGLLIEDHAPQDDGKGNRNIRPYGSSFWRRWPDVGIGMEPIGTSEQEFELSRWRGDRVAVDWPKFIARGSLTGSSWPFEGRWT